VNVGDPAPAPGSPILEVGAGLARASAQRNPADAALQQGARTTQALVIGKHRVAWDGTRIPPAALQLLDHRIASGTDSAAVVSEVRYPDDAFVVPSGALIAGTSQDRICVARFDATAQAHTRVSRVTVLTSNQSGAVVEGDLGASRILFNPGEMGVARC
jgi:hypothetical protein